MSNAPLVQRFPNGVILTKFTDWVLNYPDGREYWYHVDGGIGPSEIEHITLEGDSQ